MENKYKEYLKNLSDKELIKSILSYSFDSWQIPLVIAEKDKRKL